MWFEKVYWTSFQHHTSNWKQSDSLDSGLWMGMFQVAGLIRGNDRKWDATREDMIPITDLGSMVMASYSRVYTLEIDENDTINYIPEFDYTAAAKHTSASEWAKHFVYMFGRNVTAVSRLGHYGLAVRNFREEQSKGNECVYAFSHQTQITPTKITNLIKVPRRNRWIGHPDVNRLANKKYNAAMATMKLALNTSGDIGSDPTFRVPSYRDVAARDVLPVESLQQMLLRSIRKTYSARWGKDTGAPLSNRHVLANFRNMYYRLFIAGALSELWDVVPKYTAHYTPYYPVPNSITANMDFSDDS